MAAAADPAIPAILEYKRQDRSVDLAACMRMAGKYFGLDYATQARDIWACYRGAGNLGPAEYYTYGLYDHNRYNQRARQSFLGAKGIPLLLNAIGDQDAIRGAIDKMHAYRMLVDADLPVPKTFAVWGADVPTALGQQIGSIAELESFFDAHKDETLFGKPVAAVNSLGVLSIERYDPSAKTLIVSGGRRVTTSDLIAAVERYRPDGYQFQERLKPHPDLAEALKGRIGTIRVWILCDGEEPQIIRCAWKIPGGSNPADNFWRPGNLLAAVDPKDGTVVRVIDDVCPRMREHDAHPDTGAILKGRVLPDWQALRRTVLSGARVMSDLPAQGWDVALTDRGPVLVELEPDGGHPMMVQIAHGHGLLLDPRVAALTERVYGEAPSFARLLLRGAGQKLRTGLFGNPVTSGRTKSRPRP